MRDRPARLVFLFILGLWLPALASAQLSTPPPELTAENESWYLSGAPINVGGNIYYPSGPVTHFSRNEMVLTGMFDRIPIYKKTTQEPGSIVYVPLPGGLVRPYERRRSGDLAGTVGSSAPSFPVVLPAQEQSQAASGASFYSAPAPTLPQPVGTTGFLYGTSQPVPRPVATIDSTVPAAVGTVGPSRGAAPETLLPSGPARIETAQRPVGLNAVFLEFRSVRYYAAGRAVEFASDRFSRIGDYRGFPVYEATDRKDLIYVSVVPGETSLVVPYKTR